MTKYIKEEKEVWDTERDGTRPTGEVANTIEAHDVRLIRLGTTFFSLEPKKSKAARCDQISCKLCGEN